MKIILNKAEKEINRYIPEVNLCKLIAHDALLLTIYIDFFKNKFCKTFKNFTLVLSFIMKNEVIVKEISKYLFRQHIIDVFTIEKMNFKENSCVSFDISNVFKTHEKSKLYLNLGINQCVLNEEVFDLTAFPF